MVTYTLLYGNATFRETLELFTQDLIASSTFRTPFPAGAPTAGVTAADQRCVYGASCHGRRAESLVLRLTNFEICTADLIASPVTTC